jgi:hypothetical protein
MQHTATRHGAAITQQAGKETQLQLTASMPDETNTVCD